MTRKEAVNIITLEGLQGYNLFEERPDKEDEIAIKKENENWIVYVTSERAAPLTATVSRYTTESEALESFIRRLRANKRLKERK